MTYGLNFNASIAINENGYTSIGLKANDTDGLDVDIYKTGDDSEQVTQDIIQSFFIDFLASREAAERKAKEKEQEKEDKDYVFMLSQFDDLLDPYNADFFDLKKDIEDCLSQIDQEEPQTVIDNIFDLLNGDEEEESYGGFDSWEDERNHMLNEIDDLTQELQEWKDSYALLCEDFDDLVEELEDGIDVAEQYEDLKHEHDLTLDELRSKEERLNKIIKLLV